MNVLTSTIEEKLIPILTLQEQVSTVHVPPKFNSLSSFQKSTLLLRQLNLDIPATHIRQALNSVNMADIFYNIAVVVLQ